MPHIFSNYSKLYFYHFAKNCGAKTRMLLIKIKIARCQSEVALTALGGRYFISICMYCVCSLWPLLVFVIVFRVIFVLYCSLVVILIFVLLKGLFTWSGRPRSSGVGFFCFHALGDTKQKKPTPLNRGPPLQVNRVLFRSRFTFCFTIDCFRLLFSYCFVFFCYLLDILG